MQPIAMMFGTARDLAYIIRRAKSCFDRFKVSESETSKLGASIGNRNGLHHCVLHYRAHTSEFVSHRTSMENNWKHYDEANRLTYFKEYD